MKKLKAVFFALALAAPFAVGATPADAHTDTCAGYWGIHTPVGFGQGPLGTTYQISFSSNAVCAGGPELTADAWVSGFCGLASGQGTTWSGHDFTLTWTGGLLFFDGQVDGALHIVVLDKNCHGQDRSVSAAAGALHVSH